MTPAEKMAQEVENMTPFTDRDATLRDEAAAMIRRLAAALVDYHAVWTVGGWSSAQGIAERHAAALRDVRDIPVEQA